MRCYRSHGTKALLPPSGRLVLRCRASSKGMHTRRDAMRRDSATAIVVDIPRIRVVGLL